MENDWIAIYGPQFHDYREWKVFQYVAFANDIQQNENSHVLSIEINDEGTIILPYIGGHAWELNAEIIETLLATYIGGTTLDCINWSFVDTH